MSEWLTWAWQITGAVMLGAGIYLLAGLAVTLVAVGLGVLVVSVATELREGS